MKKCSKCKKYKNLSKFNKDKGTKDGLYYWCKSCHQTYRKQHRKIITKSTYNWNYRNPWVSHYTDAKRRCLNKKVAAYPYYGGRGIKFLMTVGDFKFLWFRDKAYLMKKPSIDRIDNDGNYELSNCRFIEMSENIAKKNRRK